MISDIVAGLLFYFFLGVLIVYLACAARKNI
jgi:hypothetical protein